MLMTLRYSSNVLVHLSAYRIKEGANKEMMGIFVSYRVKVKLVVSLGGYVKPFLRNPFLL